MKRKKKNPGYRYTLCGVVCGVLAALCMTCCVTETLHAQPSTELHTKTSGTQRVSPFESESLPLLIGLGVGFDFSSHTARLVMSDTGSSRQYNTVDGSGIGMRGGVLSFLPTLSWLYTAVRIGVEGRGGVLQSAQETTEIISEDNKKHEVNLQRAMDISMSCVGVDLLLAPVLVRHPMLYVCGGVSLALPITKHYFCYEQIVSPALNYKDGLATRNMTDGDVANVRSTVLSAKAGFGTVFVLKKYLLNLELLFNAPIDHYTSDTSDWKSSAVMINLGLLKPF